jgi:hypothetical protein
MKDRLKWAPYDNSAMMPYVCPMPAIIDILPSVIGINAEILTLKDVDSLHKLILSARGKYYLIGESLYLNSEKLLRLRDAYKQNTSVGLWKILQLWLRNRKLADLEIALSFPFVDDDLANKGKTL